MKPRKIVLFLILFAMLVAACNPKIQPTPIPSTQETQPAAIEQAAAPATGATRAEPVALSVEDLMNATYSGIYEGTVTLIGGLYEGEPFVEGDPSRPTVQYVEGAELFGDLDGDGIDDAVVFLIDRGGGTAAFTHIAAQLNKNGQPANAGAVMVEDRTQILDARISDGQVVLDITTRGPGDADCCPSYKTRKTYTLEEGRLVEIQGGDQELEKISANDLNGTGWKLLELGAGNPVLADSEVTISFQDGTLNGSGGCNSYTSSFSLGDPNPFIMTIEPIAASRKACPDPILNQETAYFTALENVSLWGYRHGQLVLAYALDDDNGLKLLLFAPQEAP